MIPFFNFAVVARKMAYGKNGISISTPEQILKRFPEKDLAWAYWFRAHVFIGSLYWGVSVLLTALL